MAMKSTFTPFALPLLCSAMASNNTRLSAGVPPVEKEQARDMAVTAKDSGPSARRLLGVTEPLLRLPPPLGTSRRRPRRYILR